MRLGKYFSLFLVVLVAVCCKPDPVDLGVSLTSIEYESKDINLNVPSDFPNLEEPTDNPISYDGVKLGQHLFYDPILSRDSTMSCSSCHLPENGFTDNLAFSVGIDGVSGERSAMSLVNMGFHYTGLFWDGRVESLEEQALLPVENPIELHNSWSELVPKLRSSSLYQTLFRRAFGISNSNEITKELAAKGLAQFERVIISGNSRFDLWEQNLIGPTDEEIEGLDMFFDRDPDLKDAECFHCHGGSLFTDLSFRNNGLDSATTLNDFADLGRGAITGNPLDNGKFRVPTLRNISLTAPYMHDGRFETLAEVIDHYNSGGHLSPNKDPLLNPLGLTEQQKKNLELFLLTLVDTSYLDNEFLVNPFN